MYGSVTELTRLLDRVTIPMFKRDLRGASRTRLASGSWFLDRCGEGRGEDGMPFTPEVCDRVRADVCL